MKPQPEPSTQEVLAGLVERVTFHNVENGFCVLRAKARGHRELVTVIGHAAIISAGEWITATGDWVNDRTHGQQFKARFLRTSAPTSADGIEKYLSSGMIRGVGPAYAKKLVRAFGEKVFDVIEATPDRLREVEGIGPVRAASILAAWAEQKAVREIMVFLYSHGVGTGRRPRIWGDVGAPASPWQADATIAGPPGAVRTAADTKLQLPMGSFSGLSQLRREPVSNTRSAFFRMVKSVLSPDRPKNTGMKSATIKPRNCSSIWRVRMGDSPTRTPATKAPSTL
jgi:predicted flap endonuclease-1-like 5' DNA nuclease